MEFYNILQHFATFYDIDIFNIFNISDAVFLNKTIYSHSKAGHGVSWDMKVWRWSERGLITPD